MKVNFNQDEYYQTERVSFDVSPSMLRWLLVQINNCPREHSTPTFKDTGEEVQSLELEAENWISVAQDIVGTFGYDEISEMFDPDNGELNYLDEDDDEDD